MDNYNLSVGRLVNTVILSKAAEISLEEAATVVVNDQLGTYITENNLVERFMELRRELAAYMREKRASIGSQIRDKVREKARHYVGGVIWNNFVDVLANWYGTSTQTIVDIQAEYNLNPARTVNVVVLSKVANIDLQVSASIVVNGELCTYLRENNLVESFKAARMEVMALLRETASTVKDELADKVAEVLARWSGFDKDQIKDLIIQLRMYKAINIVVLAKVAEISFEEAKDIVLGGNLVSYLRENGLFAQFHEAKIQVMIMIRQALTP